MGKFENYQTDETLNSRIFKIPLRFESTTFIDIKYKTIKIIDEML